MEMNAYEAEHLNVMRALAPECTVLLKKKGDFPLRDAGKLALYGSGARQTVKGGTGSGDVNSRFFVTAEQGLEDAGFTITSKAWLDGYDAVRQNAKKQFIADIKRQAKEQHTMAVLVGMGAVMAEPAYDLPMDGEGDTAVYVLSRNSGEGSDRKPIAGDVMLTSTEIRDILACKEKYEHFMLVLNVGGVVDLTPVRDVENILILSQLGAVTGNVLADILLGKVNPSGKLTTTWSAWGDYPQIGSFGDPDETDYTDGIYVGYRYFDSVGKKAMFPFGFGLSFTEFTLGAASVSMDGTRVTVAVPVTNVGTVPGKEVVQVYVSSPWGKLDQPAKALAGFCKTGVILPGETETVTVTFAMEHIASYDAEAAAYILEQGNYIVRVGNCSTQTVPCAAVHASETITVRKVTNIGGKPDFTDWKPERRESEDVSALPVLELDAAAFASVEWPKPHRASAEARKKASGLTNDKLVYACMGHFKEGVQGLVSVIGDASVSVAGAAGESTDQIRAVPSLVMADGPAGLRLSPKYTRDKKGAHSIGVSLPGMDDFMGSGMKFMMKLLAGKPKGEILEQYCTAIPIGTALAQSWNLRLCEECGDVVGSEMELFGVDLWLAPAFNIHRSILCGRNFEYYSEDPLVSGLVGAAVTRGVQHHDGRGATVKHFCCNNQETNRYCSDSRMSERTLREIYTRGFEICIRESNPAALMTSYNLLNGIHTSERSDLMQTLLRGEWGYDGLIMTDWVVSAMNAKGKYRMAKSAPTIAAGNDVFMPGSAGDYKLALDALNGKSKAFNLTRAQAEYCAAHLFDLVWRLKAANRR